MYCVVFEQYMSEAVSVEMGIEPEYLSELFIIYKVNVIGCIHILRAKHDDEWFSNTESIVQVEYPKHYEIINTLIK